MRRTPDLDRIAENLESPGTVEAARMAIKLAEASGHVPVLIESLKRAGTIHAQHGDWKRSIRYLDRAIVLVGRRPSRELASLWLIRAQTRLRAHGARESRATGLAAYEAFKIADAAGDVRTMAEALCMACEMWAFMGSAEQVRQTLPHAAILAEECGDASILANVNYTTGSFLMYGRRYDDALGCFLQSVSLSEDPAMARHLGIYLDGAAACLTEAGEYRSADPYFAQAIALFESLALSNHSDSSVVGHAASYIARGEAEEGLEMLYPVMIRLRGRAGEQTLAFAYYAAAIGTLALNDLRRAYDYANRALRLSTSIADLRHTIDSHRLLASIAERSASSLWSMHAGQRSSDTSISEAIASPVIETESSGSDRKVDAPASAEAENGHEDLAGCKLALKRQSRELLMSGLQLSRNNERMLELRHRIEPFLERDDDAGRLAAELIELLGPADDVVDQQGALGRQFHDMSSQFLKRLSARHPALTVTELRICTLLRSSLSSKEIARMLNLSPHTVDTHRLQIRRKLGLSRKESIYTYLISFD
jgi:DNA-binding CsgD family transcriptional regulator/tetratricopeptide (TPR) repeat protein